MKAKQRSSRLWPWRGDVSCGLYWGLEGDRTKTLGQDVLARLRGFGRVLPVENKIKGSKVQAVWRLRRMRR